MPSMTNPSWDAGLGKGDGGKSSVKKNVAQGVKSVRAPVRGGGGEPPAGAITAPQQVRGHQERRTGMGKRGAQVD